MICWILRKIQDWLTKPEDGPSLHQWVSAPTSISHADKSAFVLQLSYVGGIIGMHHPRFKEMQADFLAYKSEVEGAVDER